MGELMETIMHRRAIRRFDSRQIEEAALQEILQAGLYAPSAGGKQGVILVVCQDKEVNERLGRIKRANSNPHMATDTSYVSKEQPSIADDPNIKNAFYDAPTVITMFAPKNFLFSAEDCAVAAENMMLAADSLGIGSCYLGQGWPAFADPYGLFMDAQTCLKKLQYVGVLAFSGKPEIR
ncbi:MAG: nitroreductase family protein [Oscillospiraceae bacterium]|nr:nitroreductase family protein [Oscillospiraceae bacterium]